MKALYRSKRITSQTSGKFLLARFLLPRCTASRDVACPYHGCSKTFRTAQDLLVHTSREHNFQPRPSPHGCEPEKLYTEAGAYYKHVEGTHSGRWPRPIKFPIVRGRKSSREHYILLSYTHSAWARHFGLTKTLSAYFVLCTSRMSLQIVPSTVAPTRGSLEP